MRFNTLEEWLQWQETLHPAEIELGLERVASVFSRLHPEPPPFKVITVAGTNGKGSSVAMLESIFLAAGYRVGCYTSPHIQRYNERVKLNGSMVDDQQLCGAFARVDQARGDTSLTYFEFGTLAALDIFYRDQLDVAVLEVGMGGRLDAVNIIDPDVALVTSIDIDHRDWLGDDREAIGREKAGIFRRNTWAICNDPRPPRSLLKVAVELDARLLCLGRDYSYEADAQGQGCEWHWHYGEVQRLGLPRPALQGEIQLQNAAGVLMALHCLREALPLSQNQIRGGLLSARIEGRFQVVPGSITTIFDVAHNPEAIRSLAQNLQQHACRGQTLAVFAALKDKDLDAMLQPLCQIIDTWFITPLPTPRTASVGQLHDAIVVSCQEAAVVEAEDCRSALAAAELQARDGDRIIVFGSFFTVAELLAFAV